MSKSDPSTQKRRENNQEGLKRRSVAVKVSKAVNCPLCSVRVYADIYLLDHFCKRHLGCKEKPSKEISGRSAQRKEAFQRIRRLFNKYSHKRGSHRDFIDLVKQVRRQCIVTSIHAIVPKVIVLSSGLMIAVYGRYLFTL